MLLKTDNKSIYQNILESRRIKKRLLAVLLDPDKVDLNDVPAILHQIKESPATHIFVGGSQVNSGDADLLLAELQGTSEIPLILFPGHPSQISTKADGILFLSLISGRNPDYLIGHQVEAAPMLKASGMEIIPTGYMLIDGGRETAVQRISQTKPMPQNDIASIVNTAMAGEMLGNNLIYLEAGSGALRNVSPEIVAAVRCATSLPIIVGGGIRSEETMQQLYNAGADMIVIGTAFENDLNFFKS
jgi:phosphoglycerol geranylgeranyltransferase